MSALAPITKVGTLICGVFSMGERTDQKLPSSVAMPTSPASPRSMVGKYQALMAATWSLVALPICVACCGCSSWAGWLVTDSVCVSGNQVARNCALSRPPVPTVPRKASPIGTSANAALMAGWPWPAVSSDVMPRYEVPATPMLPLNQGCLVIQLTVSP